MRQTEQGAEIVLRSDGDVDIEALRAEMRKSLAAAGVIDPQVGVAVRTSEFERQATGKFKRFLPLD